MAVLLAVLLPALSAAAILITFLGYSICKTFGFFIGKDSRNRHANAVDASLNRADLGDKLKFATTRGVLPVSLTWEEVKVTIKRSTERFCILQGCCGHVAPGEFCALVGPSGAGKTTLLDVLAGHACASDGQVYLDEDRKCVNVKERSVYVPQDDTFIPTLTLWETLWLSTCLRMPQDATSPKRYAAMVEGLRCMGLTRVIHSQVGGDLPGGLRVRGLSGGERRRLSIACATVAAPALIFLDECTSGLDSHAALVLMHHLKGLTWRQHTIVGSIHQPRQAIWDMFDLVVVLSEGHCLYIGPAAEAGRWFVNELGFSHVASKDGSISDWILDVVSVSFRESSESKDDLLPGLRCIQDIQNAAARFAARPADPEAPNLALQPSQTSGRITRHMQQSSWLLQFCILTWRAMMHYIRNPADAIARLFIAVGMGVLTGVVFLHATADGASPLSILACIFSLSFSILLLPFSHLSLYVAERRLFLLDSKARLYRPSAYYAAHSLAGMPFSFLSGILLAYVSYALVGLAYTSRAVMLTGLASGLLSMISIQALIVAVHYTPTQDIAAVVIIAYDAISVFLAGFLIPIRGLVSFLRIISFVSPMRYYFALVVTLQTEVDSCLSLRTTDAAADQMQSTPVQSLYDIRGAVGLNFAALCIILIVLHMASFAALTRRQ